MNKMDKSLKSPRFYLDLVIRIMCVILIICTFVMVHNFREERDDPYSANSFQYSLEEENYPGMLFKYYQNMGTGAADQEDVQEYYHVALYFEAASYYKAYQDAGDTARMQVQQKKMTEHAEKMGDFTFLQEQINNRLGIAVE